MPYDNKPNQKFCARCNYYYTFLLQPPKYKEIISFSVVDTDSGCIRENPDPDPLHETIKRIRYGSG